MAPWRQHVQSLTVATNLQAPLNHCIVQNAWGMRRYEIYIDIRTNTDRISKQFGGRYEQSWTISNLGVPKFGFWVVCMFSLVFQCRAASHQAWLVASMGFLGHNLRLQLSAEGFSHRNRWRMWNCEVVFSYSCFFYCTRLLLKLLMFLLLVETSSCAALWLCFDMQTCS